MTDVQHWRHRAPKKSKRRAILALTAALVAMTGAVSLLLAHGPTQLAAAPADIVVPNLSGTDLNAWCRDRQAAGTAGLSANAKNWLRGCIEASNPLPTPSPSPTGTPSPTPTTPSPTPTTPTPTTPPPTTTPPVTTPPPSPSPTTSSPTPTPTGVLTGCLADPGRCGYPDATSAGAHGQLAAYTGPTTITVPGTVIHDVAITSCLVVNAPNVTFRNVSINCNVQQAYVVETEGPADTSGVTSMDHVTVICGPGMHGGTAFGDERMTAVAVDISHCENGFDANGSFDVSESYIHDMFKGDSVAPAPHTDGIQVWPATATSGPIVWRHNTVLMTDDNATFTSGSPNDPTFGHGIQSNLTIDGNLLVGGSYEIYCSGNAGAVTGNRFGPIFPGTGYPAAYSDGRCGAMTRTGNVSGVTGLPVTP